MGVVLFALRLDRGSDTRESDIVWRVRYGPSEDEWFYIYVLMELQSTVQRFMALRLWVYIALLYQHLIKQKKLTPSGLLPPILPIVLYNGEALWTAPRSLAALIQNVEGLKQPDFEYVVLDAGHYPIEELRPVRDVVSGVFLMEQAEDLAELKSLFDELKDLCHDEELEEDLALLMSSATGKLAGPGEKIPSMRTFQEVSMLLERAERWPRQWEAKGLKKGKVELLTTMTSHRFGELPAWAVERFDRADIKTLDRWSRHLLDAGHLEDVFDE